MANQSIQGKRRARKLALQALYQWQMSDGDMFAIEAQFRAMNNMEKVDLSYFQKLIHGTYAQREALETALLEFLDRPIKSLNPIELSVLRLGAFELVNCIEIPYRVVLDEAISLTKKYGSQDGHRYVNGVLNGLARKIRVIEMNMNHG